MSRFGNQTRIGPLEYVPIATSLNENITKETQAKEWIERPPSPIENDRGFVE